MKTEPSKIEGVGIVPLRCEICYGSIESNHGVTALNINNAMHFVHTGCYEFNDAKEIMEKIAGIQQKTENDKELFGLMEEGNADSNKVSAS